MNDLKFTTAGDFLETQRLYSEKEEKKRLLQEWKHYLAGTRLSKKDQIKRAKEFTRKGMRPDV